jgi:glycolate oxidase iron-sulfur subunit
MSKTSFQNCSKCGLCLNVCPVYKAIKEESASPRARLQQIKAYSKKNLSSSPLLKKTVSKCLMCGTCVVNCPSGVDHYGTFMEMREKMAAKHPDPPAIRSMTYFLAKESRLKLGTKLAQKGQHLLPDYITKSIKIGNLTLDKFPSLNSITFRDSMDSVILPDTEPIGTVVYFTGCATNYLFGDTGFATVDVLKHMGFKIIIPTAQTCCSIPLLFHGARQKAQDNIKNNINVLKEYDADAIIVDCSTCGEALKNEYPALYKEGGHPDAEEISAKVVDILTFVDQHFDRLEFDPQPSQQVAVSYHAPCHTKNSFGSHRVAEALLKRLPGIDYLRSPDFDECCGGGGTFFYEYPDIAKKMINKKISNVKALTIDLWATDCPVCRINLTGNLTKEDNISVIHPLALIQRGLINKG